MKYFILVLCFFLLGINPLTAQQQKVSPKDLKDLYEIMSGSFSSEAQSLEDPEFFHISLIIQPIWKDAKDGYWLYVEQAMASSPEAPYRVRVYHLYKEDAYTLVSQVYEIQDEARFAGKIKDPGILTSLNKDMLTHKEGCGIFLRKTGKRQFEGSTRDQDCPSNLRGASYTTSKVKLDKNGMTSWDQGWNTQGEQVWGSTKGGYRFDKVKK
ncbi:chromophore lyase CpcT/CpeT [Cecembia sp.]|uniref:chromophore lyase CpcT/CpeT n=1 Tax=Cecembia sp. TaxID=1898110 RepID=UPI0025C6A07F|nr:chromophore lyase CpcT/CpeT [Cecembia sp.]